MSSIRALDRCPLPFKGRARVGMGFCTTETDHDPNPIPLLTSPLKGEGLFACGESK